MKKLVSFYRDYNSYVENTENPLKYKAFKKVLYKQMDEEKKQQILDLIWKGIAFGAICKIAEVTLDEVCCVFEANTIKTCISSLNKEAK